MELTQKFFRKLQNELKKGTRRSVYLNATIKSNSKKKLDLFQLSNIDSSYPRTFLDKLFTQPNFSIPIDLNNEEHKPFIKVFNEIIRLGKDIKREKGVNTIGFGYPLIIREASNKKKVVAPLIIWNLRIRRVGKNYLIEKSEEDAISLNQLFINHTESDLNYNLKPIPPASFTSGFIDKEDVIEICFEIVRQLQISTNQDYLSDVIKSKVGSSEFIPSDYDDFVLTKKVELHWGGLFTIFETQKQSILNEYKKLIELDVRQLNRSNFINSNFQTLSSIETDPSQQGVLNALKTKNNLIIHGPPGTGKSQTLTAIIINALENRKNVLVVCEKSTALEVLNEKLMEQGLESLFVQIMNSKAGRSLIVEKVQNRLDNKDFQYDVDATDNLKFRLNQTNELIEQINSCHQNIQRRLKDGKCWTDIVGDFLQHRADDNTTRPVDLEFDSGLLKFTQHELEKINDVLEIGESLYFDAAPYHSSCSIKPEGFSKHGRYRMEKELRNDVLHYKKSITKLKKLYDEYIEDTRTLLMEKYEEDFKYINDHLTLINETFTKYLGDERFRKTKKNKGVFFKLLENYINKNELLNEKNRKKENFLIQYCASHVEAELILKKDKEDCLINYQSTLTRIKQIKDFSLLPVQIDRTANIPIEEIHGELREWFGRRNGNIVKVLERIDSIDFYKTLPSYEIFNEEYKLLKIRILQVDGWVKDDELDFSSIPKFFDTLKIVISKTSNLLSNNGIPFGKIYNFQQFINGLENKELKIIESLKPYKNWMQTFNFYYLDNLLIHHSDSKRIIEVRKYEKLRQEFKKIKDAQTNSILNYWFSKQELAIQEKGVEKIKFLYTDEGNKNTLKSLRQIIENDLSFFQNFFPVVLTNPVTCSTLFGSYVDFEPFDFVIFDEASQLKIQDTLPSLLKGKQKIISGDRHQMPPSDYFSAKSKNNEDDIEEEDDSEIILELNGNRLETGSLLELVELFNFENCPLNFHYRSQHEYLIDFSNAAFYKNKLYPKPRIQDYVPIDLIEVNGTYKQDKKVNGVYKKGKSVNLKEAEAIIEFLKELEPGINGEFPSVGIATFNKEQRKLIEGRIAEIKESKEYNEKFIQLDKKGLFVNNLINIQGFERDIILISTTYGEKYKGENESKKFSQNFGPLNKEKGYKLLNVIVTRAKEKLILFTSIPQSYYLKYQAELAIHGNNRKGIFYAYLSYAMSVRDGNETKRLKILEELSKESNDQKINSNEDGQLMPFQNEIHLMLKSEFPKRDLKINHSFGGFKFDIVILSNNTNTYSVALEFDGAPERANEVSYLHDLYREKILKDQGIFLYRIWSEKWWRDWKFEFDVLVEFVYESFEKVIPIDVNLVNSDMQRSLEQDGIISKNFDRFPESKEVVLKV